METHVVDSNKMLKDLSPNSSRNPGPCISAEWKPRGRVCLLMQAGVISRD